MIGEPDERTHRTPPDSDNEQPSQRLQAQLQDRQESGSVTTDNGRHTIHCLTIIGQIEGHYVLSSENKTTKYEHVFRSWSRSRKVRRSKGC